MHEAHLKPSFRDELLEGVTLAYLFMADTRKDWA